MYYFRLGQAFQSIKQSVPTEETFRQTIYNNKGTLERFVESLQNRVLESYSEGSITYYLLYITMI